MAVSDTIRWNAAAFQTKSFFCNTCVVRFVSLYYLTAIRYRAGGTVPAGGSSTAPILGRKRRKSFSFKISYIFSYVHPQIFRPSAGNTALARTMTTSSNQRNDSKSNPCADPILGRNRRKTCAFKISFISYHLHPVLSDFQVFCRYCSSDQRNDSVLTPKMWAVLGFLEEQS